MLRGPSLSGPVHSGGIDRVRSGKPDTGGGRDQVAVDEDRAVDAGA